MNMEFPLAEEKEGGKHEFLMKLRASKLKDDALIESFYDKIIENYDYPENYYIILVHAVYDIPGRTSDGIDMDDASEEIYEHLLCSICPVKLSKAGLCYNAEANLIPVSYTHLDVYKRQTQPYFGKRTGRGGRVCRQPHTS